MSNQTYLSFSIIYNKEEILCRINECNFCKIQEKEKRLSTLCGYVSFGFVLLGRYCVMSGKRFLSKNDHQRILSTLEVSAQAAAVQPSILEIIRKTLSKAKKIDQNQVPQDLITMNSKFVLKDLGNAEAFQFTLVYPDDYTENAPANGKLSLFSAHGSAVLGARVGEVVRWEINGMDKYLRVQELLYQPAAI